MVERKDYPIEEEKNKGLEMVKEVVEKNKEKTKEIRHQIHQNPELGFQEFETAKLVKARLQELGIEIVGEGIGQTGIIARIKGKEGGRTVALRADMDALPIQEKTDLPYASKKEKIMHACGHDVHTSSLLGAAEALKSLADQGELEGDVLLIFQPNEERTDINRRSGAVQMIKFMEEKGLRKNLDAIFGLHVLADMERGTVKLPQDIVLSGSSSFKLKLEAPGGHVSEAFKLPNIEKLLAKIETRMDQKFGSDLPKEERPKVILEPGLHKTDSEAVNILSTKGEVSWTLRILLPGAEFKAKRREVVQELQNTILEVAGPYEVKGAKWDVDYNPGTRPVRMRDLKLVELGRQVAKDVLPNYKLDEEAILGGEDCSYYFEPFKGKTIDGVFMMVGGANSEKGIKPVGHHRSDFKIDEDVIPDMSIIYAEMARRYLAENYERKI